MKEPSTPSSLLRTPRFFPFGGFFFDASSVQTEYSNVQTEMEAVITPIIMGVISYEDGYESALKRLKDAGLDTVVAEYQRQFNAYMGK